MAALDFDQVIEQCQLALGEFVKGNLEPMQRMFSNREDVTLANPIAPPARGWEQVAATMERAVSNLRDGEIVAFENVAKYVTPELAYIVWIERSEGRVGGREDIVLFSLRVTMIFRPEEGTWKVVHRHADPITTAQPAESMNGNRSTPSELSSDGGDLWMAAVDDVDEVIEQYHLALGEFMKGNPEPAKKLFSHREDVSLANPQGSDARGWEQVAETMERAASTHRDGRFVGFENVAKYVTPELAYVVEVERLEAKVYGGEDVTPYALRVTMIFRPEDGVWKVVHRHADQITTAQPAESMIQE